MAAIALKNETPHRLTIRGLDNDQIVLAPLQQKWIEEGAAFDFSGAEKQGLVSRIPATKTGLTENEGVFLIGGGFWLFVIACGLSFMGSLIGGLSQSQWRGLVWGCALVIALSSLAVVLIRSTRSLPLVIGFVSQMIVLGLVLAIGIGLPGATIYFFGGGSVITLQMLGGEFEPNLSAKLLQLAFIPTASLMPVLLFFLFDRFQLKTLRDRLYRDLFRLDQSASSRSDIDAKYGAQIAETFGTEQREHGRLSPVSRWPVLVCAFIFTIGWIMVFAPIDLPESTSTASSLVENPLLNALVPQPSSLVFGFLGVYFYSLRLIAVRYARGDLKPKAYTHIMVRVFIVAVLCWVLDVAYAGDSNIRLVLAFLFGITPDSFFTWLREVSRGKVVKNALPEQALPLSELEGIDLYDRGRLESEGIVNIEGLAHHELIDLIIETRIPVPRLIDWIDQSILYLHLAGGSDKRARVLLRDYGIRTATDLLQAWDEASRRDEAEFLAFKRLLGDEGPPYRLEVIRDTLCDDEWLEMVKCWRENAQRGPIEIQAIPESVSAWEKWATRNLHENRHRAALAAMQKAIALQETASTRLMMARFFATSMVSEFRDREKARDNALRAFQLDPENYAALLEIIDLLVAMGEFDEALSLREKAVDLATRQGSNRRSQRERQRLDALLQKIEEQRARREATPSEAEPAKVSV